MNFAGAIIDLRLTQKLVATTAASSEVYEAARAIVVAKRRRLWIGSRIRKRMIHPG
jgi:hypothetical protein